MNKDQMQDLFFDMMEEVFQDQPINESVEDLDEATAIYEAVEEFFVEHYRTLTIEEQIVATVRRIDVNEDLNTILIDTLLDESIGTAVATAVHAIGQKRAELKAKMAANSAQKASEKAHQTGSLAAKRTLATKQADKAQKQKPSAVGAFKAAFTRARSDKQYAKYQEAGKKKSEAIGKSAAAQTNVQQKQQKRADLAQRVDAKVAAAKQKVKSGLHKAASFVGRVAGKVL